jgi:hypothetical protein
MKRNIEKINEKTKASENSLKLAVKYIQEECDKRYGFHADPKQPVWQNKLKALTTMYTIIITGIHPSNLTFHNLECSTLPPGSKDLLGLGLKFCIQQLVPQPEVQSTMTRLARSIHIRQHTMTLPQNKDNDKYSTYHPST